MNENIPARLDASLREAWNSPEELPEMHAWLAVGRDEAARAQYALTITKKHFARAGVETSRNFGDSTSWYGFGWDLYSNVDSLIQNGEHSAMLRDLFAELVDFCESAFPGYFAYYLKEILEKLMESTQMRDKLSALLPAKAVAQLSEIDRMIDDDREERLWRQNQMGY